MLSTAPRLSQQDDAVHVQLPSGISGRLAKKVPYKELSSILGRKDKIMNTVARKLKQSSRFQQLNSCPERLTGSRLTVSGSNVSGGCPPHMPSGE